MSEFHPPVSIIIPVYNGSNYLRCAIGSALAQDYDNVEVIVVNDGSKDNSGEIAKSYGEKIRYFEKENGGVSTALNMGIEYAKGEYISWLSHDDYYLPHKISRQIEELGKMPDRGKLIACSGFKIIDLTLNIEENNILSSQIALTRIDSLKFLYEGRFQHGCSFLIPIEAFNKIGLFDMILRMTQDYDLWFRLINSGYVFFYISEILMVTRQHKMQDTIKNRDICMREQLKMWQFANKLFYGDIAVASRNDKKIFYKKKYPLLFFIKSYIYWSSPFFTKGIWEKLKKVLAIVSKTGLDDK